MTNDMLCDATLDGPPDGNTPKTQCEASAPFRVERMASNTDLYLCPEHLGPVLMNAEDLPWPPAIHWEGPGERPPKALSLEEVKRREAAYFKEIRASRE